MPADFDDICDELEKAKKDIESLNSAEEELSGTNESLATSFHNLSEEIANATKNNEAVKLSANQAIKELEKLERINKELAGATSDVGNEMEELADYIENQVRASKKAVIENKELAKAHDVVKLTAREALSEIDNFEKALKKQTKTAKESAKADKELAGAIGSLSGVVFHAVDGIEEMTASYKDSEDASASFKEEVEKQASLLGLFTDKLKEGEKELKSFGDGLEDNATKGAVFAAAFVFLTEKISELGEAVIDTVKDYAKFNVELDKASRSSSVAPGGVKQLRAIQDELNLVNDEFEKFLEIAVESSRLGSKSIDELSEAYGKLQDAFGGEQIELLREYVDLLEQIPNLETDLSINANLDDRAASIFDLIKTGKLEKAFELQGAGLLGGAGGADKEVKTDVQLLNVARDTQKIEEEIKQLASEYFPMSGIALTAIAGGTLALVSGGVQLVATVGGTLAAIKALNKNVEKSSKQEVTEQRRTTDAVLKTGGKQGLPSVVGGASSVSPSIAKTEKLSKRLGKGFKNLKGKVSSFAKSTVGSTIGLGVLASGLSYTGGKLKDMGDEYEKEGDRISASMANVGEGLSKIGSAAAAGAGIGLIFGPLGAAIGGATGAAIGFATNLDLISKATANYHIGLRDIPNSLSKLEKSIREYENSLKDSAFALQDAMDGIGDSVESARLRFNTFEKEISDLNLDSLSKLGGSAEQFSDAMEENSKLISKRFNDISESLRKERKKIISEGKLNAQDRKTALLELHRQEIEATTKFVDGMQRVLERLGQSPDIIKAELKKSFADFNLEKIIGVEGFSSEDATKAFNTAIGATTKSIKEQLKGINARAKVLASEDKIISDNNQKKKKDAKESASNLTGVAKETLGDFDVGGSSKEDATKKKKEVAREIKKLEEEIAKERIANLIIENRKILREAQGLADEQVKKRIKIEEIKTKSTGIGGEQTSTYIGGVKKRLQNPDNYIPGGALSSQFLDDAPTGQAESLQKERKEKFSKDVSGQEAVSDLEKKRIGLDKKRLEKLKRSAEIVKELNNFSKQEKDAVNGRVAALGKVSDAEQEASIASVKAKQKIIDEKSKVLAVLGPLTKMQNNELTFAKEKKRLTEDAISIALSLESGLSTINQTLGRGADVTAAKRSLELIEQRAGLEIAFGNSSKSTADRMANNNELIKATIKDSEDSAKNLKKLEETLINNKENVISTLKAVTGLKQKGEDKDLSKEEKKKNDEKLKLAKEEASNAENALKQTELGIKKTRHNIKTQKESVKNLSIKFIELYEDGVDSLKKGFNFKTLGKGIELGELEFELGEFGGDLGDIAKARELIVSSSQKQFELEKKTIKASLEAGLKNVDADTSRSKKEREEQKSLISATAQADLANAELRLKKQVVDASKKERDFKLNLLDMDQEGLDEQISFLQEIGGSYGQIFELQKQGIGIERQKLELAEENLARVKAAGIEGPALRRAELDVQKQGFALQKKALGAQRSSFEKILGMAFGGLRKNSGLKRGVLSDASVFGRGFVQGAGTGTITKGGGKTLQERRNAFSLEGKGQRGGGAVRAGFESLGGVTGKDGFKARKDKVGDKKNVFGGKDRFEKAPLKPEGKGTGGNQITTVNSPGGMKITIESMVTGEANIVINPDKATKATIKLIEAKAKKTENDLKTKAVSRKL